MINSKVIHFNKMSKKHWAPKSFSFAFEGLKSASKNEPNLRIHLLFAVIVISLGLVLKLKALEFAIIILTISLVITLELINTMLEALVDLVSPEIRPAAKLAKDVAASAVLVSAITSIIVGLLIFLPRLQAIF